MSDNVIIRTMNQPTMVIVGNQAVSGPNSVTSATTTNITGIIGGDGSNVYEFPSGAEPIYNEDTELFEESAALYGDEGQLTAEYFITSPNGLFFATGADGIDFAVISATTSPLSFRTNGKDYRFNAPSTGDGVQWELPNLSGTFALTTNTSGIPDKLTNGTIAGTLTVNSTTITYGAGAASAHRTALGLLENIEQITGLQVRLAADELRYQGSAAIANNDPVSAWRSTIKPRSIISEVVFTASTTARPTYHTNIQNSLAGVFFDGTNDMMIGNAALMSMLGNTARTVFVVCKPTALASGGSGTTWNRPQIYSNSGQYDGLSLSPSGGNNIITAWDYDSVGLKNVSLSAVAPNTTLLITQKHSSGVQSISLNQGTPVTTSILRECINTTLAQLGSNGAGSGYYHGYIFEILMYYRALTTTETSIVETYLKTKWGV